MATLRMNRHGLLGSESVPDLVSLPYGELLDAQVTELSDVLDEVIQKIRGVKSDRGLNTNGIEERVRSIGNLSREHIKKLSDGRRQKLDLDLEKARKGLPSAMPAWQKVAELQHGAERLNRLREIRNYLMSMSAVERLAAAMGAAEEKDEEVLLAISTAPGILNMLAPNDLQHVTDRFNELAHPEQFQSLSSVQQAITFFESNQKTTLVLIGDAAGIALNFDDEILPDAPEVRHRGIYNN